MTDVIEIQTTCPSPEVARALIRVLLDDKLAACCQIGARIDSSYWFGGEQHRDEEVALTIKTFADLFEKVAEVIREHHPYDLPAIFGFAVPFVEPATREWIAETCVRR